MYQLLHTVHVADDFDFDGVLASARFVADCPHLSGVVSILHLTRYIF